MTALKVAIVGTGIFARDQHLPSIQKLPNLEVVSAFNRTRSKALEFAQIAGIPESQVYESLEQVFEDPAVDIVDALLPAQFTLNAVKLALASKKPIMLEKPIAANMAQAREIVQITRDLSVPVAILENWLYLDAITILKEKVLPQIGEVISFTYNATGPWNEKNKYLATLWRQNPEHIGGFLSDGGVHQLALLTGVLGPVSSVGALTRQVRPESGDIDVVYSTMTLESGAIGTFTYGLAFGATEKTTSLTIMGKNGLAVYDFSPSLPNPVIKVSVGSSLQQAQPGQEIQVKNRDTFALEFENFAAAVEANDKSLVHVTPEVAFHHLAIVAAAIESSKLNGTTVSVEQL